MSVDFHLSQYTKVVSDLRQEVSSVSVMRHGVLLHIAVLPNAISKHYQRWIEETCFLHVKQNVWCINTMQLRPLTYSLWGNNPRAAVVTFTHLEPKLVCF